MNRWIRFTVVFLAVGQFGKTCRADEAVSDPVDFNRDVRPILSDVCFKCHGPDEAQRVSSLRLDTHDGILGDHPDGPVIAPGVPADSRLWQRITSSDADRKMPPPDSGRTLSRQQIDVLTRWIREGAPWTQHWAFVPVQRPKVPATQANGWVRSPIDAFVLARMERDGLTPSSAADKTTWIRRASLTLTGLPPSLADVDAFVQDKSDSACDTAVDRLLASPHYGERMAVTWLDAARYADTSGYQNDGPREMWRWRDWVISAFNTNMPFDQFTIRQLAGDLLPNATLDDRIATAFNRNHRGNAEGGIVPEEYQIEYVVDRVDTTSTVWLGLTMGCARCHDHKYDPISQKEFYQVFAYFNNIPEYGRAIKEGNSPPMMKAPTASQQQQLSALDKQVSLAEQAVRKLQPDLVAARKAWETGAVPDHTDKWTVTDGLSHRFEFDGRLTDSLDPAKQAWFMDGSAEFVSSMHGQAAQFSGSKHVDAGDIGAFGYFDSFSLSAWVHPTELTGTIVSRMISHEQDKGYAVHLQNGRLQVNLVERWLDDSIRVESQQTLVAERWQHVTVTYNGSRKADGIKAYLDGEPLLLEIRHDFLNQTFATTEPFRIGAGRSHFLGGIDDVRIYDRVLSAGEAAVIAVPDSIAGILKINPDQRSPAQAQKLIQCFLENHAAPNIRSAYEQLTALQRQRHAFDTALPTVMVMEEMPQPRETRILHRGQYDAPGDRVSPDVPGIFPPLPEGAPNNRLGFAQWLVMPEHPLTARAMVNRIWQMHFGSGLVTTPEDFGAQGSLPSHPQLLDWLAAEFIDSGWDIKSLHRKIVTSATYRQSSQGSAELRDRDPDNRLLARGPRFRLPAETIRDQALFVSGLLTPTLGGPSVRPYQPDGLWKEIATTTEYDQSHGPDLYRRSLYTYWKRTVAAPTMVTLDATSREACTVQRSRTNTPLQALALMNEVTFVEAARVLAQKILSEPSTTSDQPLQRAFRSITGRLPDSAERQILASVWQRNLSAFRSDPEAAGKLIAVGEFPVDRDLDAGQLATMTTINSLILNLDEVLNLE
ncbi:MAG: DUF1553 domain-containing protein [Planctomycetaceae bacterium]